MSFKENLQYLRGSRNMTQEQLAMLLGVSRQAISKWESEKAYPEMDKLLMLCDMFGVTLDDLVMGDVRASAGCGGAGRVDLAADTDGVAASVGVADAAVGAVPGVIGFAASQVAGMSDSGESDAQGAKTGVQLSVSPESDTRDGTDIPQSVPRHIVQDVVGYDSHMRRFAWLIAIGVAAIILGVAVGMLFSPEGSVLGPSPVNDVLVTVCTLVGAIVGLALLIPAGIMHGDFRRRHPYVQDFYTDEDKSRASVVLAIGVAIGAVLILAGVCVRVFCDELVADGDAGWPDSVLLACVAAAAFCFIMSGMTHDKVNVDKYNREAEEESVREGRSVPHPTMSESDRFYSRLTGAICGVIMLLATVVALLMLFLGMAGSDVDAWMKVFWVPWPIGGVLCGVVVIIVPLVKEARRR
ncbi:helix-turn-helix transcriptional regulator [Bifidobacterium pseudocatenulatum]|uniref:helix-turn-helix transcriptional regulator n=1 Tax=Bifidobacterium pseudocatenulatum TaxID=28026 RepID=UPI0011072018|nr:helix-turn-helix transcriptional regulator [Bifidobacterium pseudocatenulatum]MDB6532660.1 helix-turn-helix domain-containing protein [Bifidobacterium pseudocatenulatum]MDB6540072.1 helix-turn-helix domain-containing protein [Bifidobacterium pseudocatenulatum]MDB6543822.1 helix-turn-helix domain-containing protein [Bifidobacterium pseudocatenulatum]